jgi:hypothetical protein
MTKDILNPGEAALRGEEFGARNFSHKKSSTP